MERWLEPFDDDPAAAGRGSVSAVHKSAEEGDAMPDR
jgi:hypothetical protein